MDFNLLIDNRVSEVVLRFTVCATNPGLLGDHKKCRSRSNPLICLSVSLSLCLSVYLSQSLCSLCISVFFCLSLTFGVFLYLSLCVSFSLSFCLFCVPLSLSVFLSVSPYFSVFSVPLSLSFSLFNSYFVPESVSVYLFSTITSFDIVSSPYPTQSVFHSSSACQLKSKNIYFAFQKKSF
jgi:hypothetical protein